MTRLTIGALQSDLGIDPATPGFGRVFGPRSKAALFAAFSNPGAPALIPADFAAAATRLGVPVGHIVGVRKVEAPRGPFDDQGRPTILYERHKFRAACDPAGCFDGSNPDISGPPYGAGGYGPFSAQYDRLAAACALDPHAAFAACSWGAFQVMGENAAALGYGTPYEMAKALRQSESAHLDSFVRFVEWKGLTNKLRACRPNDPDSCRDFVRGYNGANFEQFNYHEKFARAIA